MSYDAVGSEHLARQLRAQAAQVAKAASDAASTPWHRDGMSDTERDAAFREHSEAIRRAYAEAMTPYRRELRDTAAAYWHSARAEGLVGADDQPDMPLRLMNPVNDYGLTRLAEQFEDLAARANG